jgi:hypothetical protein
MPDFFNAEPLSEKIKKEIDHPESPNDAYFNFKKKENTKEAIEGFLWGICIFEKPGNRK